MCFEGVIDLEDCLKSLIVGALECFYSGNLHTCSLVEKHGLLEQIVITVFACSHYREKVKCGESKLRFCIEIFGKARPRLIEESSFNRLNLYATDNHFLVLTCGEGLRNIKFIIIVLRTCVKPIIWTLYK